jgi:hypothetical protein
MDFVIPVPGSFETKSSAACRFSPLCSCIQSFVLICSDWTERMARGEEGFLQVIIGKSSFNIF